MALMTQGVPTPPSQVVAPVPSLRTSIRPLPNASDREQLSAAGESFGGYVWRTGVSWVPVNCMHSGMKPRCLPEDWESMDPAERSVVSTDAFFYYTLVQCDQALDGAQLDRDVTDVTEAHASWALAQALWFGHPALPDHPDQPTLRRVAQDISGSLSDSFALSVARLLTEYAECTGGNGGAVLHVPDAIIPTLVSNWLVRQEGDLLRGPLGSIVSPGPGYPHGSSADGANGFGPLLVETPNEGVTPSTYDGNAADEVWIYVTGPLDYALGETRILPDKEIERRGFIQMNQYDVWAEREAIIRFDPCCVFAALTTNPAGVIS